MLHWVLVALVQYDGVALATQSFDRESACEAAKAVIIDQLKDGRAGYNVECIADGFAVEHDFGNVESGISYQRLFDQ